MAVGELSVVLGAALIGGLAGTGLARLIALRTGFVNQPNPIVPDHTRPVAYLGGVGIAVGAAAGLAAAAVVAREAVTGLPVGLVVGAVAMLAVGLYDDLRALGAAPKLGLQVLAVALAIVLGGVVPPISGQPLVDTAFTALWLLAVVNGFNFIDVLDGLAGSIAVATLTLFGIVFGSHPALTVTVVGGTLGFLAWNRPPARVFMGDAGSHFLGFLLAGYAIAAPVGPGWWPFLPAAVLFLAPAWFDLVFQTTVRMSQGRRWWVAGPDSFALHLRASGLTRGAVVAVAVSVSVVAWLVGAALPALDLPLQLAALAAVAAFVAVAWVRLLRWPVVVPPRSGSGEVA